MKEAGAHRARASARVHEGLVGQIAIQDIVARIAAVVTAGRVRVVGPGIAEFTALIVAAPYPLGHHDHSGKRVLPRDKSGNVPLPSNSTGT
ncbi:Uncharacterised protein [Mycobacteroides abscessus subsp. massiliense]|nr:Uncharacterised protein [Mycobacteroides abscessus subsp. massiliense]